MVEPEWWETQRITQAHLVWMSRLFQQGYNLNEVRTRLRFISSYSQLRKEVRSHGYRIGRKLVPLSAPKRAWKAGTRKFSEEQLGQIDRWLDTDHYSLEQVHRLIRFHFPGVVTPGDRYSFEGALRRSGYAWRYYLATLRAD